VRRLILDKLFEPPEELLALDTASLEPLREELGKLPPSGGIFGNAGDDRVGVAAS
jgi:hypothetical protein